MDKEASVINIIEPNAKSGVGKNNKPWSMARVELSNKESVFVFNPVEIGDVLVAVQNGEYINWQKKKADPKHDEIMGALRAIYKAVTEGVETPAAPKVDAVVPVIEGTPVNLDEIPF